MKTDIVEIIDLISKVDGNITITNLSLPEIHSLQSKIIWSYSEQGLLNGTYTFGDKTLRPQGSNTGLVISTGSIQFDYELKALMILLFHMGNKEGGLPYKWRPTSQRVRTLAKFSNYCHQRKMKSFRDIEKLSTLKLRTILLGFITDGSNKGGMNSQANTSTYKVVRDSLKHLITYGLVTRNDFWELIEEITQKGIIRHEVENRLRHSIIPTCVMKKMIIEAIAYIDNAEAKFDEFAEVFRQSHLGIALCQTKHPKNAVYSSGRKAIKKLKSLLKNHFQHLQRHTYALVLAFTGMRDSEAGSLKTGCAGHRIENGEELFYAKSLLTKTADNAISLDWVTNEPVFRSVSLLSNVNELYYERANLFLKHQHSRLTAQIKNDLEHGLADRLLFGLRLTLSSTHFVRATKSNGGSCALDLHRYTIPVTEADITQLEKMECNYRSVSANSGYRGIPYVVGAQFNLTAHQFRHTFAWFIIANRLGDLDDIKYQFKHLRQAMTFIYTERGFKSLNELRDVIEYFDSLMNKNSINDIVQAAATGHIAGGGGERLSRMLQSLNFGNEDDLYGTEHQPHFKNIRDVIAFTTRHSDSIRGLPHGYCTKGAACKIKNAADPSHCLYYDTYFATPKHLVYWRTIKENCAAKLKRIGEMPLDLQMQLQVFRQSLEDNMFAAIKIINRLDLTTPKPIGVSDGR